MRVAVATQDMARVDAHLGWARHLMIYEVSVEGYRYLPAVLIMAKSSSSPLAGEVG